MSFTHSALIVLASGLSARFGAENKLLAELSGKPLLSCTLETFTALDFGRRIVVSPENAALEKLISAHGFSNIINPHPAQGQGNSLSLGASAALSAGLETLYVALADMPFVSATHIQKLRTNLGGHDIIMSEFGGSLLPPALFTGKAAKALTSLSGDQGAKSILQNFNVATVRLTAKQAQDIDTHQDLEAARQAL